ncbi:helix-turn-helix transcriptional regulator [Psychromonas aquatilis]|uniref:AlpA family phage regulatory protein n=1 Tax=Psychromonas aquatilis TaxID=2005072 RepID=A0ABU9GU79_9GAMM
MIQIVKLPTVLEKFCISRSLAFLHLSKGLLPPSISLGERSKGFILSELDAVLSARVAGQSNDQIKALVKSLVEKRKGDFQ